MLQTRHNAKKIHNKHQRKSNVFIYSEASFKHQLPNITIQMHLATTLKTFL